MYLGRTTGSINVEHTYDKAGDSFRALGTDRGTEARTDAKDFGNVR